MEASLRNLSDIHFTLCSLDCLCVEDYFSVQDQAECYQITEIEEKYELRRCYKYKQNQEVVTMACKKSDFTRLLQYGLSQKLLKQQDYIEAPKQHYSNTLLIIAWCHSEHSQTNTKSTTLLTANRKQGK